MFHIPLVQSRKPAIMTWLCFKIFTSNLVKMATQSSSKSFPIDMSEPDVMLLKTWADIALEESLLESCKVALKAGLTMFLLDTWTAGTEVVYATWQQCGKALGCR